MTEIESERKDEKKKRTSVHKEMKVDLDPQSSLPRLFVILCSF